MNPFFQNIRDNTEWLNSVFFQYKLFYYDLWSLVHLWSGAIIFAVLTAYKVKKRWMKLLLTLSVFKVVETLIFTSKLNMFRPEKSVDILNDIAIGMFGGYLMHSFFKWGYTKKHAKWMALFISSITIAFLWVGWYGYSYTISFFNSPYINWWALISWTVSGMTIIYLFSYFKNTINYFFAVTTPWLIYLIILFAVEYIAYHLLYLRETTQGEAPLIFDVVHGSKIMHGFYVGAPLYFIGLFILLDFLLRKYEYTFEK